MLRASNLLYAVTMEHVLVASADDSGKPVLTIDRTTHAITAQGNTGQLNPNFVAVHVAHGLLGVIRLLSGLHLILVTDRRLCGRIAQQEVWQLTAFTVVAVARNLHHLSDAQIQAESTYLTMLRHALNVPAFYFSYSSDFSVRLGAVPEDRSFCWNQHLLSAIVAVPELVSYALPVAHGFVSINASCTANARTFSFALVSRRSTHRAGKRFTRRGADIAGYVANYVETEQIVETDSATAAFLMVRGSVPVLWDQQADLRYKPRVAIDMALPHLSVCTRHFQALLARFGNVYALNLARWIDQRGMEQQLGDLYLQALSTINNPHVRYLAFDFHKECRKLDWGRLAFLLNQVREDLCQHGYMLFDSNHQVVQLQTGVFRVNCIDCLDRTNVVQSVLGRFMLQRQLEAVGILASGDDASSTARLEALFKGVWADHADAISLQYSGSGALKTDFTRTGQRSLMGMIRDGVNSLQRYYINNFADGFCQDATDLLLGQHVVAASEGVSTPSPLADDPALFFIRWVPVGLMLCLVLAIFTALMPPAAPLQFVVLLAVWLAGAAVCGRTMAVFGPYIVDQPRLVALDAVVFGLRSSRRGPSFSWQALLPRSSLLPSLSPATLNIALPAVVSPDSGTVNSAARDLTT